ncbi:MAG TPA: hypothetical protein VGL50_02540 [Steroidobacteraceae bacterium]|jgi:hypothetical protein
MIEFEGQVECRQDGAGAINLVLRGRDGTMPAQALFAAADAAAIAGLPAKLHEVRLMDLAPDTLVAPDGAARLIRLSARETQRDIGARSVQLHRDASREFFGAVPPPRLPARRRLAWTALLWLLKLPGVGSLLVRLRGNA